MRAWPAGLKVNMELQFWWFSCSQWTTELQEQNTWNGKTLSYHHMVKKQILFCWQFRGQNGVTVSAPGIMATALLYRDKL